MEDWFLDYLAFEFVEDGFCEETEYKCPACDTSLLLDVERAILLCPECRGEYEIPSK